MNVIAKTIHISRERFVSQLLTRSMIDHNFEWTEYSSILLSKSPLSRNFVESSAKIMIKF